MRGLGRPELGDGACTAKLGHLKRSALRPVIGLLLMEEEHDLLQACELGFPPCMGDQPSSRLLPSSLYPAFMGARPYGILTVPPPELGCEGEEWSWELGFKSRISASLSMVVHGTRTRMGSDMLGARPSGLITELGWFMSGYLRSSTLFYARELGHVLSLDVPSGSASSFMSMEACSRSVLRRVRELMGAHLPG
ncbi:hypothetical protein Dimus_004276 [Dionaea muscipula]